MKRTSKQMIYKCGFLSVQRFSILGDGVDLGAGVGIITGIPCLQIGAKSIFENDQNRQDDSDILFCQMVNDENVKT